ncbi:hypothetical protein Q4508_14665 [Amphritea sp. 2_MG-2023]|uniref:hypothetical protein n=1 Tax=Amphritea TaxID=515417 RepID=UPI001C0768A6|nr:MULTISPECIES: hypothetical protein [Amphritea]MBU2966360.1 hypothetical protein [Amphritea atlantica]MDO6419799.1 hypothetical protein [Amphritea sp. 2_MG-2023]
MATDNKADHPANDSFSYDDEQRQKPVDDPLAAIKKMRLEQLAVCRLKTEKELQAMQDKANKGEGKASS